MSIDVFVTYTTDWHEHQVWTLVESVKAHYPDTPVYVLTPGAESTVHPQAISVHAPDLVGDREPLFGEILNPFERVLALLPRALIQVLDKHQTAVMIEPGCLVVGPLTEIEQDLTQGSAALTSQIPATDVDGSAVNLRHFINPAGSLSHRVLGVSRDAVPALETWVRAMSELFDDPDQRAPSTIHVGLASAFAAMTDLRVANGTLAVWDDYIALRTGPSHVSSTGSGPAIVACDELFEIARETALGRYQSEDIAQGMVRGRVHDLETIEPLMEPIRAGVEHTKVTRAVLTPFDDLVYQVWRSADPFGYRWHSGERKALVDWLYTATDGGLTRLAHIYWHMFLRDEVANPHRDIADLRAWNDQNAMSVFGVDLFDRSSADRPTFPEGDFEPYLEGFHFYRNALKWRLNTAKGLLPGWRQMARRRDAGGPAWLRTRRAPRRRDVDPRGGFGNGTDWLSLIGWPRSESGLGEAARATFAALQHLDRRFSVVDLSAAVPTRNASDPGLSLVPKGAFGDVNLVHANIEQVLFWANGALRTRLGGRYNIGFWFWEPAHVPRRLQPALEMVDELWVATDYLADVFGQYGKLPVHVVGISAELPEERIVDRSEYGLDNDDFVFLFVYDAFSAYGRKNPDKLLRAFRKAFGPRFDGVRLILKATNLNKFPRVEAEVMELADGADSITIIDQYLSRDQILDLMAVADAYVSLHAAEGYGLTLLEAMALGTPCIATAYSGNMDFMDESNSWLVDYRLTETKSDTGPYPRGSVWAEPSIDHAAELMRAAFQDRATLEHKGSVARVSARRHADLDRYAKRLDAQLRRLL